MFWLIYDILASSLNAISWKIRTVAGIIFVWVFFFALTAFGAEPIGAMTVEWRIVATFEDVQAECKYKTPVRGCWMKKADGRHVIVTLPPRGFKDHERWWTVMHELSHVQLGCFHDARGQYIGPEYDDEECRHRQTP